MTQRCGCDGVGCWGDGGCGVDVKREPIRAVKSGDSHFLHVRAARVEGHLSVLVRVRAAMGNVGKELTAKSAKFAKKNKDYN